jgi:hypothetical protein
MCVSVEIVWKFSAENSRSPIEHQNTALVAPLAV